MFSFSVGLLTTAERGLVALPLVFDTLALVAIFCVEACAPLPVVQVVHLYSKKLAA